MLYMGEIIRGKWNDNSYIVLKKLGQGGVGSVYKVKDETGHVKAIKISEDINSITREYENMQRFKTIDIVPRIYEIDDYNKYGERFYFFVLEYISGYNLKQIMKVRSFYLKDILSIGIIISRSLKIIYDYGYVYGDIKLENIMIEKYNKKIYLIDFGGAVDKSLGIKEYTPTYNMVSWGLNNKGNIENIIFSVNMLMVSMLLKEEPSPLLKNLKQVSEELKCKSTSARFKKFLVKTLCGRSADLDKYITELKGLSFKLDSLKKNSTSKSFDIVDFIFKGSISIFILVLIIGVRTNWM